MSRKRPPGGATRRPLPRAAVSRELVHRLCTGRLVCEPGPTSRRSGASDYAEAVLSVLPVAVHQDITRAAIASGSDGRGVIPK